MTNEWHVRRICSAISSTIVTKAFLSTSRVTGSRVYSRVAGSLAIGRLRDVHADVQPLVDLAAHAGRHEDGGVELVDESRPLELHPGRQLVAAEDRRLDRLGFAGEADVARAAGLGPAAVAGVRGQLRLAGLADRLQVELVDLDGRVVAPVGMLALVL